MSAHVLFVGGEDHFMRIPFFKNIERLGFRVTAAASGDPAPFKEANIEYRQFAFSRFVDPAADLRAIGTLSRLICDVDADIAHSFDTKTSLLVPYAARSGFRTAIVRTINGRGWTFSSRSVGAFALRCIYRPLQRFAAASTAATVFEHHGDRNFFMKKDLLGDGPSIVIPGAGIDIDGFERARATGAAADDLRRELDLLGKDVLITTTRVTREKGIPTLLKAAALVNEKQANARFLIVGPRAGEGSDITDQDFARHAGYVIAPGARRDVPALLNMADAFVFPSEYAEGIPRSLMEAALAGLPIVTTDLPGCQEVIRDGWNGVLVPQRNPKELAAGILRVLADREAAQRMGARGPAKIRQGFGLSDVAEQHAALYERVLTQDLRRQSRSKNDPKEAAECLPGW